LQTILSIAIIFKDSDIRIAFRKINTVQKHPQPKQQRSSKYDNSGVHKLKCMHRPLQHIDETGRSFHARYKEYIHAIKYNKDTSTYAHTFLMPPASVLKSKLSGQMMQREMSIRIRATSEPTAKGPICKGRC
jgi:hypothetical protein